MKKSLIAIAVTAAIIPLMVLADENNIYSGSTPSVTPSTIPTASLDNDTLSSPYSDPAYVPASTDLSQINSAISSANALNSLLYPTAHARLGDGLWFGVQTGPTMGNIDNNLGYGSVSMPGGLFGARLGYGYTFINGLYLGAQFEADYQDTNFNDGNQTYSIGNIYALSLLPGYHFSPNNMLYLKLGTGLTDYQISSNIPGTSYDSNKSVYLTGIGYDTALSNNLSLGLEYNYLWLPSTISPYSALPNRTQNISENLYLMTLTYQLDPIDNTSNYQGNLNLNGPYVGAQGGAESVVLQNNGINYGGSGLTGILHAGYGYLRRAIYLAAEGWIAGHTAEAQTTYNTDQTQHTMIKQSASYGLAFIPGYTINSSRLLYGRIGPEWSNVSGTYSATNPGTYSKLVQGWQVGAGYETGLTNNVSLSLEYDYNWFSYSDVDSYKLNDSQVSIGLNYRW